MSPARWILCSSIRKGHESRGRRNRTRYGEAGTLPAGRGVSRGGRDVRRPGRPAQGQTVAESAEYTVTFQGAWTTRSTPGGVVGGAHFTTLIGAVHNHRVTFWSPGGTATPGIEAVAELGSTGTFRFEILAKGANVASVVQQSVGFGGTGRATFDIRVTDDHPLLTLVSMIGPSPDWFVGVPGLSLLDAGGRWYSSLPVDLYPYDAGTEEGEEFSLSNPATSPQGTIAGIRGTGKFSSAPMATLSFVRKGPPSTIHHVPLFTAASDSLGRQGFARIVNHSNESGEVRIDAFDDEGTQYGPLHLAIGANETVHVNSPDLENGNAGKGLDGATGPGRGHWRLELASALDIEVLGYLRTDDGFVTSMHDVVPHTANGHHVAIFNPGRNVNQVSRLRIINRGPEAAEVSVEGIDGRGESPGTAVRFAVPARGARMVSARELESAHGRGEDLRDLVGALGVGTGKWRLVVKSDRPILVMSLLASPTGHLTNLSTAPDRMGPGKTQ